MSFSTRPNFMFIALVGLVGCGPTPNMNANGKTQSSLNIGIVGGIRVQAGTRLSKQVAQLDKRCTATFIAPHIALTAAHCFPDRNVTTGTLKLTDDGTTPIFETKFDDVSLHSQFDPYMSTSAHDLALLHTVDALPEDFQLTPLAERMTKPKTPVTAAGRGLTYYPEQLGPHPAHDMLLRTVELQNLKLVKTSVGLWYNLKIDLKAGVSSGDSGGPLFAEEDGVLKQIAVASSINDDQTGEDVAYTSVVQNADWIQKTSAELTARAPRSH